MCNSFHNSEVFGSCIIHILYTDVLKYCSDIQGELYFRKIHVKPLTPNDPYRGRTAPLTSKRCILYIYSTNIGTEYFKNGIYSPFFPLESAVCFIILTYFVPVIFTFYIVCAKIKKK